MLCMSGGIKSFTGYFTINQLIKQLFGLLIIKILSYLNLYWYFKNVLSHTISHPVAVDKSSISNVEYLSTHTVNDSDPSTLTIF